MIGRRVLITADAVGGVWQYTIDLAAALASQGVSVLIVTLGPTPNDGQRQEAREAEADLIETDLPLDWLADGPASVLSAGAAVAAIAQREQADVIHLNTPALAAARLALPTIAVTHGCVATWWRAVKPNEPLAEDYHWHRALMNKGLRAVKRVVAPTDAYARVVQRQYGLKRLPTVVLNGRRTLITQKPVTSAPEVLTVGRLWDRAKNIEILDAAAARLGAPVYAVGSVEGPHGETISPRYLCLLGQMNTTAIAERLERCPIYVSSATFEPFGLAVLEAAAAGCPLVLSDIPVFRELWQDIALFVPAQDASGFAETIDRLLADEPQRAALGAAARGRAACYVPRRMADGMMNIYAEALEEQALSSRVAA